MISKTRALSTLATMAFAASFLTPLPAGADGDPILQANGIRYACAGVGKVSREDPRWKTFHVKLEFAAANGDFMGDPNVQVTSSAGTVVFQAQCDGPWVLIDLPAGSYKVHATGQAGALTKDFPISVSDGKQTSKTIRM